MSISNIAEIRDKINKQEIQEGGLHSGRSPSLDLLFCRLERFAGFVFSILYSLILCKLAVIQVRVESVLRQQAFVGTLLDDIAVVHHQDVIRITNRR